MSHSSSSSLSSASNQSGLYENRSRPLIPVTLPAAACAFLALLCASSSACFLSSRVCFHLANVSGVTGVRLLPSLCRYGAWHASGRGAGKGENVHTSTSRNSSSDIVLAFAASSIAFFSDLRTKPGGSACRYIHFSPASGLGDRSINRQGRLTIWTFPEPAILLSLDRLNEVLAHDIGRRPRIALRAHDRP
jgi:hypothetical protein